MRRQGLRLWLLWWLVVSLTGCVPGDVQMPFAILEQNDGSRQEIRYDYLGVTPTIIAFTDSSEVAFPLQGFNFPQDFTQRLAAVDYDTYYVIGIFLGVKSGTTSNPITVKDVSYNNTNTIYVDVEFKDPEKQPAASGALSSPYSFVLVKKPNPVPQPVEFVLRWDFVNSVSYSH